MSASIQLPTGHGFSRAVQNANAPSFNNNRVMSAFRSNWTPSEPSHSVQASLSSSPSLPPLTPCVLDQRYQAIVNSIPPENEDYRKEMITLCSSFQSQGEHPTRPTSDEVKDLFRAVPFPKVSTGRGTKGGMHHHECLWPGCDFKDTLQKCMDHLFSKHMKLKFFVCGMEGCRLAFTRKFDLDKHKQRTHSVARPRERRARQKEDTPNVARLTRGPKQKTNPY